MSSTLDDDHSSDGEDGGDDGDSQDESVDEVPHHGVFFSDTGRKNYRDSPTCQFDKAINVGFEHYMKVKRAISQVAGSNLFGNAITLAAKDHEQCAVPVEQPEAMELELANCLEMTVDGDGCLGTRS